MIGYRKLDSVARQAQKRGEDDVMKITYTLQERFSLVRKMYCLHPINLKEKLLVFLLRNCIFVIR